MDAQPPPRGEPRDLEAGPRGEGGAEEDGRPTPPPHFLDPISKELMADPVLLPSGQT